MHSSVNYNLLIFNHGEYVIECEFNKTIEKLRELEKIENKICEIKYKDIIDIFNEVYGREPSNTLLCTKENMFKDKLKELFEINSEK